MAAQLLTIPPLVLSLSKHARQASPTCGPFGDAQDMLRQAQAERGWFGSAEPIDGTSL